MDYQTFFPATYYPQNYPQNYPQPVNTGVPAVSGVQPQMPQQYIPQQQFATQQQQMAQTQQMNQQQPQPQQNVVQNQMQESYMKVNNETEARDYLIAPNTSILFIDAYAPYVYIKKMGISQLDRPIFEKYRLVKEDGEAPVVEEQKSRVEYITRDEFEQRIAEIMDSKKSNSSNRKEKTET